MKNLSTVLGALLLVIGVFAPSTRGDIPKHPEVWKAIENGLPTKEIVDWGWAHQESPIDQWIVVATKSTERYMELGAANPSLKIAASSEVVALEIVDRWFASEGLATSNDDPAEIAYRFIGVRCKLTKQDASVKNVVLVLLAPGATQPGSLSTPNGALVIPVYSGSVEQCEYVASIMQSANTPTLPPSLNCLPVCICECDEDYAARGRSIAIAYNSCLKVCIATAVGYGTLRCLLICVPVGAAGGPASPLTYALCLGTCMSETTLPATLGCVVGCTLAMGAGHAANESLYGGCLSACD